MDDSLLRAEVAGQILASGAYGGRTRVEEEGRRLGGIDGGDHDDDNAFFVNVGDLELAEGYHDDAEDIDFGWEDLNDAAAKRKKKMQRRRRCAPVPVRVPACVGHFWGAGSALPISARAPLFFCARRTIRGHPLSSFGAVPYATTSGSK